MSPSPMTTSPSTADVAAAFGPGSTPDVALLQRLANQLFREHAGDPVASLPTGSFAPQSATSFHGGATQGALSQVPAQSDPMRNTGASPAGAGQSPAGSAPAFNDADALTNIPGLAPIAGLPGDADLAALLGRISNPTAAGSLARPPVSLPTPGSPKGSSPATYLPFQGLVSDEAAPAYHFLSDANPARQVPQAGDLSHLPLVPPTPFPVDRIRQDFPILKERVNGRPLVWLDNAATTQKPRQVIDRLVRFYEHENSNIHRAAHTLAARSTDAYEGARESVRRFLNAGSSQEIVFVRGATEGINLVARTWGRANLKEGDEVLVSHLEHHANIVPWQQVTAGTGAKLRVIPVDDRGALDLDGLARLLTPKVKLVSITQVSNALGTVVPVQRVIQLAHAVGARVLVDGAQSVSHMPVDVRALNADWFVFSGHKVFAPTGIGAVYGRKELLDAAPPWQGGGNMIKDVTFEHTEYHDAPARFEAGTGNIADAVGLGAALDYLMAIGMERIAQYEHQLIAYTVPRLAAIPGVRLIGNPPERAGVVSFIIDGLPTTEVGRALDQDGVAVRSGHHCAQPILRRFGQEGTVRPSFALYNTCGDIDTLIAAVARIAQSRR